jgi:hypothetical protein
MVSLHGDTDGYLDVSADADTDTETVSPHPAFAVLYTNPVARALRVNAVMNPIYRAEPDHAPAMYEEPVLMQQRPLPVIPSDPYYAAVVAAGEYGDEIYDAGVPVDELEPPHKPWQVWMGWTGRRMGTALAFVVVLTIVTTGIILGAVLATRATPTTAAAVATTTAAAAATTTTATPFPNLQAVHVRERLADVWSVLVAEGEYTTAQRFGGVCTIFMTRTGIKVITEDLIIDAFCGASINTQEKFDRIMGGLELIRGTLVFSQTGIAVRFAMPRLRFLGGIVISGEHAMTGLGTGIEFPGLDLRQTEMRVIACSESTVAGGIWRLPSHIALATQLVVMACPGVSVAETSFVRGVYELLVTGATRARIPMLEEIQFRAKLDHPPLAPLPGPLRILTRANDFTPNMSYSFPTDTAVYPVSFGQWL